MSKYKIELTEFVCGVELSDSDKQVYNNQLTLPRLAELSDDLLEKLQDDVLCLKDKLNTGSLQYGSVVRYLRKINNEYKRRMNRLIRETKEETIILDKQERQKAKYELRLARAARKLIKAEKSYEAATTRLKKARQSHRQTKITLDKAKKNVNMVKKELKLKDKAAQEFLQKERSNSNG